MTTTTDRDAQIQEFWNGRVEPDGLLPLSAANGSKGFQEHPIWAGVIMSLLDRPEHERPIRRVADLGCGTGMVAEVLARLGYDVIAIDFAEQRAAQARHRLEAFERAEVRVGDANKPPLETGEIDAVVSRNLLWLLTTPQQAVQTWSRIVGAGGRVAAIDSTRRTSRHRLPALQKALGWQKYPDGVAPGSPVSRTSPTPFSDIHSAQAAAALWQEWGVSAATGVDLSWVSSARTGSWTARQRALRRDRYFAVYADV